MDPDACLAGIAEIAKTYPCVGDPTEIIDDELYDMADGLDGWLQHGGFRPQPPPQDWCGDHRSFRVGHSDDVERRDTQQTVYWFVFQYRKKPAPLVGEGWWLTCVKEIRTPSGNTSYTAQRNWTLFKVGR